MKIDDHIQIMLHFTENKNHTKPYFYALLNNVMQLRIILFSEYQIEQVYEDLIAPNGYYAKGNYRCAQAM